MSMSFGYTDIPDPLPAALLTARQRVFDACRANNIHFLEHASPDTVVDKIDDGITIISAADEEGERTASIGRAHFKANQN